MCHFMADDSSDTTIVNGIVSILIKERRLKNACRENDFIILRVVICINSRRGHTPFSPVNGFAYFIEFIKIVPTGCIHYILEKAVAAYIKTVIFFPLIR